jgi:hypothetical protein
MPDELFSAGRVNPERLDRNPVTGRNVFLACARGHGNVLSVTGLVVTGLVPNWFLR